jgi:integrase
MDNDKQAVEAWVAAKAGSQAAVKVYTREAIRLGSRSAELLAAKLSDIQHEEEGWVMQVRGKGFKNRIVTLLPAALQALNTYLQARGLGDITHAPPVSSMLASPGDPMQGVGYPVPISNNRTKAKHQGWVHQI